MAQAAAEHGFQPATPDDDPPVRTEPPIKSAGMRFSLASGAKPLDGYTIKRGVGIGGFGEVYFAVSDAGKEVALKRINRNLEIELRGVRQCLNLKHVNLIDLYDIRHDEHDEHWVVMEFVAGESLGDALDRHPNGMPPEMVRHWFSGMLAGVGYLHDHGIVHRDLKPGNIFIDDGIVKIGDYGLSKFISCSRRSGHTESVGTLHYMAPEIGQGRYGKEIDIYALGILLHELVTGNVPFDGESSQEIIIKHLTARPTLTGIDEPFRSVIAKALEKDPNERYSDVREIAAALELDASSANSSSAGQSSSKSAESTGKPSGSSSRNGSLHETVALKNNEFKDTPPSRRGRTDTPPRRRSHNGRSCPIDHGLSLERDGGVAIMLVVSAIVAALFGGPIAIVLVAVLAVVYASSAGVRAIATPVAEKPAAKASPARELLPDGRPRYFTKAQRWRQEMLEALNRKPLIRRAIELTDGMVVSAVIAAVLSLVMMVVAQQSLVGSTAAWSLYMWLFLTTTTTSWSVLWMGKFWEGREADQILRRFVMLAVGLGIGALAWSFQSALMVDIAPADLDHAIVGEQNLKPWYDAIGEPQLGAFLAYFAGLLVVPRWWKQADPLRTYRLGLWPIIATGLWAFVLGYFWPFPQPWGWMIAAASATAIQVAAPWIRRNKTG